MFNILALVSVALASLAPNITLIIESDDESINGSYIENLHFGAAINGALLTPEPVTYSFNSTDGSIYQNIEIYDGPIPFVLGETFNEMISQAGGIAVPAVVDSNGLLSINGSSSVFYSCDKIEWDPYRFVSATDKGIGIYNSTEVVPDYCSSIKIKAFNTNCS